MTPKTKEKSDLNTLVLKTASPSHQSTIYCISLNKNTSSHPHHCGLNECLTECVEAHQKDEKDDHQNYCNEHFS